MYLEKTYFLLKIKKKKENEEKSRPRICMKILRIRINGVVNPDPIRSETLRLVFDKILCTFYAM
jgi:hypothetical protein